MNRHRLVLLNLPYLRPKDPRATLGDASLRARLTRESTIDVVSITRTVNETLDRPALADVVLAELARGPSMLGIGCYIWNEAIVQWLLPELRRRGCRGPIMLGGPQITYARPGVDCLYPDADIFIRGYAEEALPAVLMGKRPAGVTFVGCDDAVAFAKVDVERLESPILTGILPLGGFQRWETQRGCLYRCTFCQWPGGIDGVRRFPAERIERECERFASSATTEIAIQDPIFNSRRPWLDSLRALERHGYRGRVSMQLRPETFGSVSDFVRLPLADRCKLEFGLQTVHAAEMAAIERNNILARCDETFAQLRAADAYVEVSLIYGLPCQTFDSFRRSVDYALARATAVRAFPLQLLRGTSLHDRKAEFGLVEDEQDIPQVVQSPTFTRDDHERMARIADDLQLAADTLAEKWRESRPPAA